MTVFDPTLLRQEVNELTDLLRHAPNWSELRDALESKDLPTQRIVLAGFMEDSEGNERGVVITDKQEVFEFQRNTTSRSRDFVEWRAVTNTEELLDIFPAVKLGLEVARDLQQR